tara:strand:+ start:134 stop:367 length:234 start_codon:yes stop_codon:yes gene_type:complete
MSSEMDRNNNRLRIGSTTEEIRDLVDQCIFTHNEEILVNLIFYLEKEYIDIARLGTLDAYEPSWTHEEVLNYMTYHT